MNYFNGLYRSGPTLNLEGNKAYFEANPNRFALDPTSSLSDSTASDYDASEKIYAGYAMATVEIGKRTTLLAGLRVEHTETAYGANELSAGGGTFSGVFKRVTGGAATRITSPASI